MSDELDPTRLESTEAAPSPSAERRQIGPYRLLQKLGEGGMGEVYQAEQDKPVRRKVALKLIKAGMDTKQVVARFESERQALALMDHPSIARVFDAGASEQGHPYFAMEFVKGEPITTYCDRHRLATRERLELFMEVCDGVQHAHQKGIIHRDIKPSNVLVAVQEGRPVAKIIDFGVAKATEQRLTEKTLFTQMGVLVGTPEYMSPEQAEMGALDVDTRTDVFSLGVMLYELLVGALPLESKALRQASFDEIRRKIREDEPPRPSTRLASLGEASTESASLRRTDPPTLKRLLRGDLDWITMKAVDKDRTRRYGSPSELAADVRRHLQHEPVLASPPSVTYRMGKFVRRHRVGVAAASLVLAATLLGFAGMTYGLIRATRAEAEARRESATAEQVSEFLVGLFEVVDPGESRGNSITAREILDRGADDIEARLEDQPVVQGRLLETIGKVYAGLGLLDRAESVLERSLETRRQALGPDHVDTLSTMFALADVYSDQTRNEEAEALWSETLEKLRSVLGEEHPATLRAKMGLAWTYYVLPGRNEEALSLQETVLATQLRVLGEDDLDTLGSLYLLGCMMYKDEVRSVELLQRAVDGRRRLLGPDHPETLKALDVLAGGYGQIGHVYKAEAAKRELLEVGRRVLGPEHYGTLMGMVNLAGTLQVGGFDEAEALLLEVIEKARSTVGEEHTLVLYAMSNLALIYGGRGRYEEAEALHRERLEIASRSFGAQDAFTLYSMSNLAFCYSCQGRLDEAEALHREILETSRRSLGEDHTDSWRAKSNLAEVYTMQGRYDLAEPMLRDSLEALGRLLGEEDPGLIGNHWRLARLLLARDGRAAAEPFFERAFELKKLRLGEESPAVAFDRGRYHALVGESDKAVESLRIAVEAGYWDSTEESLDLASLEGDPGYDAIVAEVMGRAGER